MSSLPQTKSGNFFIITCKDPFTKWVIAKALPAQNALAVANFVLFDVCLTFSLPLKILTDQGTSFVNAFTTEMYRLMDIKRVTTTAYRSQTNGSCERYKKALAHMLSEYVDEEQRTVPGTRPYSSWFSRQTLAHTTSPVSRHSSFCLAGANSTGWHCTTHHRETLLGRPRRTHEKPARFCWGRYDRRQNYVYATDDHPEVEFQAGDFVLVFNPAGKPGEAVKLLSWFHGPYRVLRKTSPVN